MDDLQKRIDDLYFRAKKSNRIYVSDFFKSFGNLKIYDGKLFGGRDDAERVAYFALPDFADNVDYGEYIKCIKITPNDKTVYGHSDYLGSVMALQLDRDKLGDIIVVDNCAYLIGFDAAISFVYDNLQRISRTSCRVDKVDLQDIPNERIEEKEYVISCSSLRLDCALCACFNISREKAKNFVESGYVKLCGEYIERSDKQVKCGDVISLKGYGRAIIDEICGTSKKGKIRLRIKK